MPQQNKMQRMEKETTETYNLSKMVDRSEKEDPERYEAEPKQLTSQI